MYVFSIPCSNPNFGNKGELNPISGVKRSQETIDKIRENTLKQFLNYSDEEINFIIFERKGYEHILDPEIEKKYQIP